MERLQAEDPERVGDYRLLGRLGAGGMGVVYLGRSPAGRAVAVKVIRPRLAGDTEYRARFRREAAIARTVAGVFTAAVLDADPDAAAPWLVTAYLPGLTLYEAVSTFGALPPASVRALAAALAEALADLHRAGLAHRDFKPGNIMLTASGPRVIDFGIARPEDATAITRVGTVLGTPGYMAPEQVHGAVTGTAVDVFALGAVLAFAATARKPFGTDDRSAVLDRVSRADVDLDGIDDHDLLDLLAACLRVEPTARPSAAELLDRLGHAGQVARVADWLPPTVAAAIERRAATIRLELAPAAEVDERPAVLPSDPTMDPPTSPPVKARRHVSRRAVLLGGAALAAAAGGVAVAVRLAGNEEPGAPDGAAQQPSTRSTTPVREWRVRVSDAAPQMYAAGGVVMASVYNGGIRALDPKTGGLVWQRDGDIVSDIAGDTALLVNPKGWQVSAVDAGTGRPKWTYGPPPGEVSRSAVVAGEVVCFGTTSVRAIGTDDGRPRWTAQVSAERGYIASGDVLVCTSLAIGTGAGRITGLDVHNGHIRWTFDIPQQPADPRSANGMAYVCDAEGTIRAVRAADGVVRWQRRGLGSSGPPWLAADADAMYYSADGEIRAYAAGPGTPLWTRPIGRRTGAADVYLNGDKSTISLAGDTLYVMSNEAHLYALDTAEGTVRWDQRNVASMAAVESAGLVFVGTYEGYVEAIRPPGGG